MDWKENEGTSEIKSNFGAYTDRHDWYRCETNMKNKKETQIYITNNKKKKRKPSDMKNEKRRMKTNTKNKKVGA